MTAAAANDTSPKADAQRRGLYATISIGCKDLGIDEESRRDMLAARYGGRRSMTQLSIEQLEDLLDHLKAQGFKPKRKGGGKSDGRDRRGPARAGGRALANAPEAKKARALWLSLYHLGVVRNPSESALAAFGKRQTGKEALQWIKGDWHLVIEALKKMGERDAGVCWDGYRVRYGLEAVTEYRPRCRVLEAQWRILGRLGVVVQDPHALAAYASTFVGRPSGIGLPNLTNDQADKLIEHFGGRLRKAQVAAGRTS